MYKDAKNILIIGALGMLGKELVVSTIKEYPKANLRLCDLAPKDEYEKWLKNVGIKHQNLQYFQVDITNRVALQKVIKVSELVFHVAGIVSYNNKHKEEMFSVNVEGTKLITQVCEESKVNTLIYASSISTIALSLGRDSNENDFPDINSHYLNNYSKSKIFAEQAFFENKDTNLRKIAVNFGVILGNGPHIHKTINTIQKIPISIQLNTYNSFVDVRDAANSMLYLFKNGKTRERYIVAPNSITNAEFFDNVLKLSNLKKLITIKISSSVLKKIHKILAWLHNTHILKLPSDVWKTMAEDKKFSCQKIYELGWKPQYTVINSLQYIHGTNNI